MGNTKALKEYISEHFSGEGFMSFVRDNIRYIYEIGNVVLADSSTHNAHLIGIYVTGIFYSLSHEYDGIGKNFMQELYAFEQLYNNAFDKQLKRYSAQKPIGGKVSALVEIRLDEFRKKDMERVALDLIFGNSDIIDKPVDHSYFEPLFLRYLLLGNKSLEDAVKADINEHADELNFTMLSEDIAYKYAAKMLRDNKLIERISLYGKIKQAKYNTFIIAVDFENMVIDNIEIDRTQLQQMIKQDDNYTYKGRLIVHYEDIIKISGEEQVIYEKIR